jgi:hypothetical protein
MQKLRIAVVEIASSRGTKRARSIFCCDHAIEAKTVAANPKRVLAIMDEEAESLIVVRAIPDPVPVVSRVVVVDPLAHRRVVVRRVVNAQEVVDEIVHV